jgi:hypothetical protein
MILLPFGRDILRLPVSRGRDVVVSATAGTDVGFAILRYVLVQFDGSLITQGAQPFDFVYQC